MWKNDGASLLTALWKGKAVVCGCAQMLCIWYVKSACYSRLCCLYACLFGWIFPHVGELWNTVESSNDYTVGEMTPMGNFVEFCVKQGCEAATALANLSLSNLNESLGRCQLKCH